MQTKIEEVIERSNKTNKQITQEYHSKTKTVKVLSSIGRKPFGSYQ